MAPPMTSEMWRIGFRNAFICGVSALIPVGLLSLILSSRWGYPYILTFIALCAILSFTCAIAALLFSFPRRVAAGKVLVDCGPPPLHWIFWMNGSMSLATGIFAAIKYFMAGHESLEIVFAAFFVLFSFFFFLMGMGRLQICENGMWLFGALLRWDRLESYAWTGDRGCTLTYRYKSWLSILGKGAVAFRDEHVQTVDDLLKRHVTRTNDADLTRTSPS